MNMTQTVFILILIVPAVLGLAELLYLAKRLILAPMGKSKRCYAIFIEEKDAVLSLRAFCEENNWYGNFKKYSFFAVYDSLSEEIFKECELLAEQNNVTLIQVKDFSNKIKEFL